MNIWQFYVFNTMKIHYKKLILKYSIMSFLVDHFSLQSPSFYICVHKTNTTQKSYKLLTTSNLQCLKFKALTKFALWPFNIDLQHLKHWQNKNLQYWACKKWNAYLCLLALFQYQPTYINMNEKWMSIVNNIKKWKIT